MKVQDYLRSGKTLADLTAELGIKAIPHPDDARVILDYDQIESPKTDPVVRECRGLVLDRRDWSLVARAFPRFFNWGEVQDEMPLFNFKRFRADFKEDGSLVLIYHWGGEWRMHTRGSFATTTMNDNKTTWQEGFRAAIGNFDLDKLNREVCYVCEFCSPWNKVVRHYAQPRMYLLGAFNGETECNVGVVTAPFWPIERVLFGSIQEVMTDLESKRTTDATFEGYVIVDDENRRWKVKNPAYLALHAMLSDGFTLKRMLPFVMDGNEAELLTYFPEAKPYFNECRAMVSDAYAALVSLWGETHRIESQKDFALAIVPRTRFSGVLFSVRKKKGAAQTADDLKAEWRASQQIIEKVLFETAAKP